MKITRLSLFPLGVLAVGSLAALARNAGAADEKPAPQPVAAKSAIQTHWDDLASPDEGKVFQAILALAATPKETLVFFKENLRPVTADPQRVARLLADLYSNQFPTRRKAEEELEYLGRAARPFLRKALENKPAVEVRQRIVNVLKRLPYNPADEIEDALAELKQDPKSTSVRIKLISRLIKDIDQAELQKEVVKAQQNSPEEYQLLIYLLQLNRRALRAGANGAKKPETEKPPTPTWVRAKRAVAVLEHLGTPEARDLLKAISGGDEEALPTKEAKAALERMGKKTGSAP